MKKTIILILITILSTSAVVAQELTVADIFTDNMVLQRKTQVPVWGTAKPGVKIGISVSWSNVLYTATAGKDGRWKALVSTPEAGGPYMITIGTEKTITIRDVYTGEVWLASGQSNMSMPLKGYYCQPVIGSNEAILASRGRHIHFINIPVLSAYKPMEHFKAQWTVASPETAGDCTAVGWFFADFIQKHLDIPVGIINASYGGSTVEAWMSQAACQKNPGIAIPPASDETSNWLNNVPTVLFNGMINPVAGYSIRGVIWYQGESNVFNVTKYTSYFSSMVEDWRRIWNEGDFPVYYAQIAPYEYKEWNFFKPEYPEISTYIREAQLECTSVIPNSGMAVLMDVGEPYQIHPPRKKEAGERLGLLALAKTYGFKGFEAESPQFDSMRIDGDKAIIYFKNQFNGLTSYGKPLEEFEIAGDNQVFLKADVYIDDKNGSVVVSSHLVNKPVAVRYAFKNYAKAELFGTGGLPVSSFRTDRWK
jgi:sialate O-acetylesterase